MTRPCVLLCFGLLLLLTTADDVVGTKILKKSKTCERKVRDGDHILLHYVARVVGQDAPFHSTYDAGAPMPLIVGSGQYFPGFHKGSLLGMCAKEVRQLTIPPTLAFGATGLGRLVPPHATVEYTVKVMEWLDDEYPNWR
eukprot:c20328_g1_i5.p2 GENE.c20328_g1_i5~~c20328_g1_i5.p2  ORF type:complete len:140 (+),score=29.12 c20328_g1_i5:959-1378(+)